jgi:hypothetical protein
MMKEKKIIIGSIGATLLILLTSYTMVIGQQAINKTTENSPLFAIRIQKSINGDKKSVSSYYLGKGKDCKISLINRDTKIELFQKIIEKISKMNDAQLTELAFLIYSNKIVKENTQQILRVLYQLKNNPNEIKKELSMIPNDTSHITRSCTPSVFYDCSLPSSQWFPGCIALWIAVLLWIPFFLIGLIIYNLTVINFLEGKNVPS